MIVSYCAVKLFWEQCIEIFEKLPASYNKPTKVCTTKKNKASFFYKIDQI